MAEERRVEDRRKKWWVKSPQQWFNLAAGFMLVASELNEFYKNRDTMPPWFLEVLGSIVVVGNIVLRAWRKDNEPLTLTNPEK